MADDSDINEVKEWIYLSLGDEKGMISIWDLTKVINYYGITTVES